MFERRDFAIFLRGQSAQYGGPRVHDERIYPHILEMLDKAREELVIVAVVDADATLDGNRQLHRFAHTLHALDHHARPAHETGAKGPALDAVAGTTDVQIDLGV